MLLYCKMNRKFAMVKCFSNKVSNKIFYCFK
nr:MAG TPA: hypothetical protein [Caudoviricetes sp.]